MNKRITIGLLLLTVVAFVSIPGAFAIPTKTIACEDCHSPPPNSMSMTTDFSTVTVSPGQAFNVVATWSGGDSSSTTAVKWPSGVLDNALFNPTPGLVYPATISGSQTFALTAPATAGSYNVRVYVSTGGNFETAFATIAVTVAAADTTAPVITITGANPASVTVGGTYVDAGATALDAVDGVVAVTAVSTVDTSVVGSYKVTYSATDAAGNKATAVRTVNVVAAADTTAPVITITGANPASVTVGGTYVDAGATALDAVDGVVPVTAVSTVDTSVVGSYKVTYSATDAAGNKATAVRTVNVVAAADTTAPVITISGANPASVTVGSTYVDAGATALDAVDGVVAVTAVSTVDTSVVGSYKVTYSATDAAGNKATAVRTVNVVEAPSPDENATITFVVTDYKTGEPIYDAEVELGEKTIKTNDSGIAIFTDVVPGSNEYEIEMDHYEEIEGKISVTGDQIVTVKLVTEEEEQHNNEEINHKQKDLEKEHDQD